MDCRCKFTSGLPEKELNDNTLQGVDSYKWGSSGDMGPRRIHVGSTKDHFRSHVDVITDDFQYDE